MPCDHYWDIEPNIKKVSNGTCTKCGATKNETTQAQTQTNHSNETGAPVASLAQLHIKEGVRTALESLHGIKADEDRQVAMANIRLVIMSDNDTRELAKLLTPPHGNAETQYLSLLDRQSYLRKHPEWLNKLHGSTNESITDTRIN